VRYTGTENGAAVFERSDLIVESNKTAMTETPLVVPNTSSTYINGYSGNRPVSGIATTTSYGVVGPRPTETFATAATPILTRVRQGETLTAEGHILTVVEVGKSSIRYSVQ
jgi:hypothetical protein